VEDIFLKVPNYYTLPIFPFFIGGEDGLRVRTDKFAPLETEEAEPFPTLPLLSYTLMPDLFFRMFL
jgi:hypothetical protein